jgi:hypothetical protein
VNNELNHLDDLDEIELPRRPVPRPNSMPDGSNPMPDRRADRGTPPLRDAASQSSDREQAPNRQPPQKRRPHTESRPKKAVESREQRKDNVKRNEPVNRPSKQHNAGQADTDNRSGSRTNSGQRPTNAESDLRNNLRSQTPLSRRRQQKLNTPDEPGTRRRTSMKQYYRIKEDDDLERKPHAFRRILFVAACYAAIMAVCVGGIALWLPHHSTKETGNYVYQVGPDGSFYSRRTYSWDVVRSGDTFYLNMTEIASYCGMTTTGDNKVMRFIVKESGETLEFVIGQSVAFVNGVQERVGGNTYMANNKVYVPVDFVNRCIIGIDATVDTENNKITVLRETMSDGSYSPISFPYKPSQTTTAIRFSDLDHDLQLQILIQNQPKDPVEDGGASTEQPPSPPTEP